METIEISKTAYDRLMSKRVGREAISTVILREIQPAEKCAIREELEALRAEKGSRLPEVKKRLGL